MLLIVELIENFVCEVRDYNLYSNYDLFVYRHQAYLLRMTRMYRSSKY